jgi:predicted Fe-Mo cluster-binding NifX family protein
MNVCIPVNEDKGLQSRICAHFGSAPLFMIVDTDKEGCRAIPNHNQHHGHGMCMPLASLQGESIDGMVVGGIGGGALSKLQAAGIRVYLSDLPTVEATVSAFKAGSLREVTPAEACGHHGSGPHGQGPHGHGEGGPHGAGHGRGIQRS